MSRPDPASRALARLLLAHEAGEQWDKAQEVGALADVTERALDKLRLHLSILLGSDGFRVLLRRAVTLARAEFPWLEGVQVRSDGSLDELAAAARAGISADDGEAGVSPESVAGGITAVLVCFLGLLETFIGQDLTLRLLKGVWPEVNLFHALALDAAPSDDGRGG